MIDTTYTPDPQMVQELAAEVLQSYARDISYQAVGEILSGDPRSNELSPEDFETLQTAVSDAASELDISIGLAVVHASDDEPIHSFFGLSYCSHLVLPRVLLQSMPADWQKRFVALIEQMQTAFAHVEQPSCYDVKAAEDVYANELTDTQKTLTGVTSEWSDEQNRELYWDADGNEIDGWTHIAVPVADPLPPYSRGRARVLRADQLADVAGHS